MRLKIKSKIIFMIFLFTVISLSSVDAYILYCLHRGESLPPGCEDDPNGDCMYTCRSDLCQICTTDNGVPGVNPRHCFDQACSFLNDDSRDQEAPVLTLHNPTDGETYGNKRVYLTLDVEPEGRIDIKDNINGGGWRTVTSGTVTSYNRKRTFQEGINDVSIRAVKSNGLNDEERVVFYVDSKDPMVVGITPSSNAFLNGDFSVEYTELNLRKVEFQYRGVREIDWNIIEVQGCQAGDRQTCDVNVDLSNYEGDEVEYRFVVYDSANSDESKVHTGRVDSVDPILTMATPFESGYDAKSVLFDLIASEEVKFYYRDNNDDNGRNKNLCNSGTLCNKLVNFRDGLWDLTIYAEDEAGGLDSERVIFAIDTKKPKAKKIIPTKNKWVNAEGLVSVEYDETDLQEINLYYGLNGNDRRIALEDCPSGKRQSCDVNVDFSEYNGEEITAYFTVSDNYNEVSSGIVNWKVDTEVPRYLDGFGASSTRIDGDVVNFDLKATEIGDFEYKEAGSDMYRNLCRNKIDCSKSKRFRPGHYTLDLMIVDAAGNSYVEQVSFDI
ncbi:MAG: hypothetical protein AABX08_04650 [Nanoarchaeota archaeon]